MKSKIYKVRNRQTTEEIIKEEPPCIGHIIVSSCKICSIDLMSDHCYVSMLVPASVFERIKNDTEFIVEENGWWTTLSDDTVAVKRLNGEVIKPMKVW